MKPGSKYGSKFRLLAPEQILELRACYKTTPMAELEERYGLKFKQLTDLAQRLAITGRRASLDPLRAELLQRAIEGYANAEIKGWKLTQVRQISDRLRMANMIFAGNTDRRHARYFDSPEKAAHYVATYIKPHYVRPYSYVPKPKKQLVLAKAAHARPKTKIGWGPLDPVHITSETKVTIAPPPPRSYRTNTYSMY